MRIVIDKHVPVPLQDGTVLAADVFRLDGRDPAPTLIKRTPYGKDDVSGLSEVDALRAVEAGYAVVVQDTRGRNGSGGAFAPFIHEADDGAGTVEWAAAQPWSDGRVGMIGGSYVGATQWLAATRDPEPLQAIAPFITAADYYEGWTYQGGAFELGFCLQWALTSLSLGELDRRLSAGDVDQEHLAAFIAMADRRAALFDRMPLVDMPELADLAPYYAEWLAHPEYDAYWRALAPRAHHGEITVPALNAGGWYDLFLAGTIHNYTGMRRGGGSARARALQRLVIGPWSHSVKDGAFADHDYGMLAGLDGMDFTGLHLRWFDHVVRGEDNGVDRERPVRLFIMGADLWRDEDDWPLPDTRWTDFYLHSGGRANSAGGDGTLSVTAPGDEQADVFLYDPRMPVPTCGGATMLPGSAVAANAGPRDQRAVEARHDVLCYTTAPLDRPVEVTGPVTLTIYLSSSALDTDITGKLVDVHPDGHVRHLTDGILRARYRESTSSPVLLEPGRVYELQVDLWATANVFAAGHRIRLEVSSSNFPRFDRNTNTGGTIAEEGWDDLRPAVNTVHHTRAYPSRLTLPIIDRR
jgi:hypothetical protein